jgi:hypothetical protein
MKIMRPGPGMAPVCILLFCMLFETAGAQCPSPIAGNKGIISCVYLNEIRSDDSGLQAKDNTLADTLNALGIPVCLTRYVLCYGDSRVAANTCNKKVSDFVNNKAASGIANRDSLAAVLASLLPLSATSEFKLIVIGDTHLDFDSLSLRDRMEILIVLNGVLDTMRFETGKWENDIFSIESKGTGFIPVDTVLAKEFAEFNRTAKSAFVSDDTFVRVIPMDNICRDLRWPFESCTTTVKREMSLYPQDQFYTREGRTGLVAINRPNWSLAQKRLMHAFSMHLCRETEEIAALEDLAIKGGNFFVREGVAFIGAQALSYYCSCPHWAASLGLAPYPSKEDIERKLACQMTGSDTGKVVWVGHASGDVVDLNIACAGYPEEDNTYQPVYHIDLFFHPIGHIDSTKDWYYIIAQAVDSLNQEETLSNPNYDTLKVNLEMARKELFDSIQSLGLVPKEILIPLLVNYLGKDDKPEYIAFANGQSEVNGSKVRYFMPEYDLSGLDFRHYFTARDIAISRLESALSDPTIVNLKYRYINDAALHCMSKFMYVE